MKFVTLDKVLSVLENEDNQVEVSDEVRAAAMRPLEKMLELSSLEK